MFQSTRNKVVVDIPVFYKLARCDPFCEVRFATVRLRSKVFSGANVAMLSEFQIPVIEPIVR